MDICDLMSELSTFERVPEWLVRCQDMRLETSQYSHPQATTRVPRTLRVWRSTYGDIRMMRLLIFSQISISSIHVNWDSVATPMKQFAFHLSIWIDFFNF
jgi:hypothetical protein